MYQKNGGELFVVKQCSQMSSDPFAQGKESANAVESVVQKQMELMAYQISITRALLAGLESWTGGNKSGAEELDWEK